MVNALLITCLFFGRGNGYLTAGINLCVIVKRCT